MKTKIITKAIIVTFITTIFFACSSGSGMYIVTSNKIKILLKSDSGSTNSMMLYYTRAWKLQDFAEDNDWLEVDYTSGKPSIDGIMDSTKITFTAKTANTTKEQRFDRAEFIGEESSVYVIIKQDTVNVEE